MHRSGFTLLEILVVVAIIGVLATYVGIRVYNEPGKARVVAAKAQITAFMNALETYRMNAGNFPVQEQGLKALAEKPAVPPIPASYPPEGYIRKIPKDPWGRDYVYLIPGRDGKSYEILTYGADGEPGGEGEASDLSSLDL
jgi:general secretion pathway protein G